jgi:hypothetical protein
LPPPMAITKPLLAAEARLAKLANNMSSMRSRGTRTFVFFMAFLLTVAIFQWSLSLIRGQAWKMPVDGPIKERSLTSRRECGCGVQRLRLGALDQKPQHDRHLAQESGERDVRDHILVLRQQ